MATNFAFGSALCSCSCCSLNRAWPKGLSVSRLQPEAALAIIVSQKSHFACNRALSSVARERQTVRERERDCREAQPGELINAVQTERPSLKRKYQICNIYLCAHLSLCVCACVCDWCVHVCACWTIVLCNQAEVSIAAAITLNKITYL